MSTKAPQARAASAASRSPTCAALGRAAGSAARHSATSAATSGGHSSGARTGRMLPRTGVSPVTISHSTTPKLKESAYGVGKVTVRLDADAMPNSQLCYLVPGEVCPCAWNACLWLIPRQAACCT